jgi:hypothetical protein
VDDAFETYDGKQATGHGSSSNDDENDYTQDAASAPAGFSIQEDI